MLSLNESGSAAAGLPLRGRWWRRQRLDCLGQLVQGVGVESVVHPAALPPVGYQIGILQDFQVEGEPRLRRVQSVGEIADAPLSEAKPLQDGEAGAVRKRVKQLHGLLDLWFGVGRHA